jgi:hypothetical protein
MAADYSWSALRMRQGESPATRTSRPRSLSGSATDESIQVRHEVVRNPRTSTYARQQLLERRSTVALYSAEDVFPPGGSRQ